MLKRSFTLALVALALAGGIGNAFADLIPQSVSLNTDRTSAPHTLELWIDDTSAPCDFFQVAIYGASVSDLSLGSACNSSHWSVETNTVNGYAIFQAACDNSAFYVSGGEIVHVNGCGWEVVIDTFQGLPYTTLHGQNANGTWDVTEWPDLVAGIGGTCANKPSSGETWASVKRFYK